MSMIISPLDHDVDDYYYDPLRVNRRIIPTIFPHEVRLHNVQRKLGLVADSAAKVGKDGFDVCVDVHMFKPEEVTLKTSDRYITIEGKHEERKDEHGLITRHFSRRYALPVGYDPASVTSELSSDGILSIKAPRPLAAESEERVIPITLSETPSLSHKDHIWF